MQGLVESLNTRYRIGKASTEYKSWKRKLSRSSLGTKARSTDRKTTNLCCLHALSQIKLIFLTAEHDKTIEALIGVKLN